LDILALVAAAGTLDVVASLVGPAWFGSFGSRARLRGWLVSGSWSVGDGDGDTSAVVARSKGICSPATIPMWVCIKRHPTGLENVEKRNFKGNVFMAPNKKKGATGSSSSANKLCFQRLQKELRAIEQNPSCLQGMHCAVNPVGA